VSIIIRAHPRVRRCQTCLSSAASHGHRCPGDCHHLETDKTASMSCDQAVRPCSSQSRRACWCCANFCSRSAHLASSVSRTTSSRNSATRCCEPTSCAPLSYSQGAQPHTVDGQLVFAQQTRSPHAHVCSKRLKQRLAVLPERRSVCGRSRTPASSRVRVCFNARASTDA